VEVPQFKDEEAAVAAAGPGHVPVQDDNGATCCVAVIVSGAACLDLFDVAIAGVVWL